MRFLDWDVLLFPIPEDGHHIPFQEFRTACYTEAGPRSLIPLMVTYVPSIQPGSDFQISLHSWSPTTPLYEPAPDGSRPKEVWQVRVVVDGLQLVVAHLPIDGSWPRLIGQSFLHDMLGTRTPTTANPSQPATVTLNTSQNHPRCGSPYSTMNSWPPPAGALPTSWVGSVSSSLPGGSTIKPSCFTLAFGRSILLFSTPP